MLEPWKMMSIRAPPVQTTSLDKRMDARELEHACNNIIRVLSRQSPLHKESALLSRFLYKYDKKFRNDIGYRNFRKINVSLKKYLQLNLLKDVENFMAVLPQEDDDYFPTRQMLEYVLVRIIAFTKIMVRISVCSKQAAVFYFDRVKRGEGHWMSLMPYALLSRVFSLCNVLLHHSTSWYTCLHRYLSELQPKGLPFLNDCTLPEDLHKWLDLKSLDNFGRFNWSSKKNTNIDISTIDDEEPTFDSILGYVSKINEDESEENTQKTDDVISTVPKVDSGEPVSRDSSHQSLNYDNYKSQDIILKTTIDHGEAVSRESINILNKFQNKIKDAKVSHYFGKVTNQNTLSDFIDKEELYRINKDKRSLTGHLSFMQWQTLKSSLIKVCDALSKNRKIERKLQKVWKEKCLDCL